MKFAKIANLALLSAAVAAAAPADDANTAGANSAVQVDQSDQKASPNTGFYLDMGGDFESGIKYVKAKVGDQWLKLGINTSTANFSIVGDQCSSNVCKVQHPFDLSSSVLVQPKNAQIEENCVISTVDNHLVKPQLQNSAIYQDDILLKSNRYDESNLLKNAQFQLIESSGTPFESEYDGFVGLGTGSKFMEYLQTNNVIDKNVFMLNINRAPLPSVVQFGGWEEGTGDGHVMIAGQPQAIKTIRDWKVKSTASSFMGESFQDETTIAFSPHLPYLYLPGDDWGQLAYELDSQFPNIDCSWGENYCRFNQGCDTLSELPSMPLSMHLSDSSNNSFDFTVDLNTHFIDGSNFGYDVNQYCYIPLFRSQLQDADVDTWFIGSLFLDEHVLIFDSEARDGASISFAAKNQDNLNKMKEYQLLRDQKEQQDQIEKQKESSSSQKQNQAEVEQLESTVLSLQDQYEKLETSLHEADNDVEAMRVQTNQYSKVNKAQFLKHKEIGWQIEATELNNTIVQARMEKLQKSLQNQTSENNKLRQSLEAEQQANSALKEKLMIKNASLSQMQELLSGNQNDKNKEYIKTLQDHQQLMQRLLDGLGRRNGRLATKFAKMEKEAPAPSKPVEKPDDAKSPTQKPASADDSSTPKTPKTPKTPPKKKPSKPAPPATKKAEDGASRRVVAAVCLAVCVLQMSI